MRSVLEKWIGDADALHHIERFGFVQRPLEFEYLKARRDDYYIALVGELFERIAAPYDDPAEWSKLGNALMQADAQLSDGTLVGDRAEVSPETALFAAAAFYFGGYSASAYLALRSAETKQVTDVHRACYELLSRPATIQSEEVRAIVAAIRRGDLGEVRRRREEAQLREEEALGIGPDLWVGWRLFSAMLTRFEATNVRAVLPDEEGEFWQPLVRSFLGQRPPVWDFFPSQQDAVRSGLLGASLSYAVQMPTGAGKTALTETLLFYHLRKNPTHAAVLLVPYRSLASELRHSIVARLNRMGISARCVYGGTVPSRDEVWALDETRVVVATPEALSGLLSADPEFSRRVSLVVCDEGHLLDSAGRGVGLELLLARMRSRGGAPPRFVFISAIVPNVEEINAWLGGTDSTVVRSDYRPALAEFAVLQPLGHGASQSVALRFHPHDDSASFSIPDFLVASDFRYRNPETGRTNTYRFGSVKTQAIAAARKALPMGAVAVFAANKRGLQGAVGLARELLSQLAHPMALASPTDYIADERQVRAAVEYLATEYGSSWTGTRALSAGVVLHHGDIPQETREVVERLLRNGNVRLAICTNTLAEGVNLPIRTLVLYSVRRRQVNGATENLLSRDIKNLVGRAGRAGSTTKGLVLCANPDDWSLVEPVARQEPGERVAGALLGLLRRLRAALARERIPLTNEVLESTPPLYTLVDGIDATLIDLASNELSDEELRDIAANLSLRTFAAQQAEPDVADLMRDVFDLRAQRIAEIRRSGRLGWIRETGTRARMLESVETHLLPLRERWDDVDSPVDPSLISALVTWAWGLPDMQYAVREAYQGGDPKTEEFIRFVTAWVSGQPYSEIATGVGLDIDQVLRIHASVLSYVLQVLVEQGVCLLDKLLNDAGQQLAKSVTDFPEHLRFGVPSRAGRVLAAGGVRHRRAAVLLGRALESIDISVDDRDITFAVAEQVLGDSQTWFSLLGQLVHENTVADVRSVSDDNRAAGYQ